MTQEEGSNLVAQWLEAVREASVLRKPELVTGLYADGAVLLPTLSDKMCQTVEERATYFAHFIAKKNLRGEIDKIATVISDNGEMVVNSGHYTFVYQAEDGEARVPARFSFVHRRGSDGQFKIITHHSSRVPA